MRAENAFNNERSTDLWSDISAVGDEGIPSSPTAAEIQEWLVSHLAELLEIDPSEVDVTAPFDRYGLDSVAAVGLTGDLEDWLGCELDPTLLYDYPTIEALTLHLVSELQSQFSLLKEG